MFGGSHLNPPPVHHHDGQGASLPMDKSIIIDWSIESQWIDIGSFVSVGS